MALKLRDQDHGYADLTKRIFGFQRPRISTGILEKDGAQPKRVHASSHVLKGEDLGGLFGIELEAGSKTPEHTERADMTVIEVACWNEFGTDDIPARSFIRAWFDENKARIKDDLRKLMQSVVQGTRTKEQILELLAQRCVGEIQQRIADGIPPENAASTIAQKGSSTPLIDTGQLRSSVSYRVEPDTK